MTDKPWSDERLAAAYRARFGAVAPEALAAETIAAVRGGRAPRTRGSIGPRLSWLGVAAVLAVVAVGTGLALRFGLYPGGGSVTDGPPGYRTFTYGDIAFDVPAEWSIRDASTPFSGGSVIAVVGTLPVSPACGIGHVDINCYYEQRLEPGTISIVIGTGAYRGGTIFDAERAAPPTVRTTVAGMPALFTDRGRPAESYYLSDLDLTWEIAQPTSPSAVYRIDVGIRGPGVDEYRRQAEALAASFRFVSPPPALDPAAAADVARVALDEAEFGDRTMWQLAADEVSWYACFDDVAGIVASGEVDSTPGEHLEAALPIECRWSIAAEGTSFWRLELETNWTVGVASGTVREIRWLRPDGTATASTFEGDFPPSPVPERPAPAPTETIEVGLGGDVTVSIHDLSGQLVDTRAAGPGDSDPRIELGRSAGGVVSRNPVGSPNELILEWYSSNCDSTYTLRIAPDTRSVILGHVPIDACTNLGFGTRAIVLRFGSPVPAAEVDISILAGTPVLVITPLPDGPGTSDEPSQSSS